MYHRSTGFMRVKENANGKAPPVAVSLQPSADSSPYYIPCIYFHFLLNPTLKIPLNRTIIAKDFEVVTSL